MADNGMAALAVEKLNAALSLDPETVQSACDLKIACNEHLAAEIGTESLSLLGLLNRFLSNGVVIEAEYDKVGIGDKPPLLRRFKLVGRSAGVEPEAQPRRGRRVKVAPVPTEAAVATADVGEAEADVLGVG